MLGERGKNGRPRMPGLVKAWHQDRNPTIAFQYWRCCRFIPWQAAFPMKPIIQAAEHQEARHENGIKENEIEDLVADSDQSDSKRSVHHGDQYDRKSTRLKSSH